MTITHNLSIYPFVFLDAGDVFRTEDGETYMKINLSEYHSVENPDNAVNLKSGDLVHMNSDIKVQWLQNAKLNIG